MQVASINTIVSAVDVVSTGNGTYGIYVVSPAAGVSAVLDLARAVVSENKSSGIYADGTGMGSVTVRVADSVVTENAANGFLQSGTATFASANNNFVAGNTDGDTAGSIGSVPAH